MARLASWAAGGLACLGVSTAVEAQFFTAVVTNKASLDNSLIPGTAGVRISSFTQSQLRLSESGTRWAMHLNAANQAPETDSFLVSGKRDGASYSVPEGAILPGAGVQRLGMGSAQVGVNDSGDLAFAGGTGVSTATLRGAAMRYNAATNDYSLLAFETDLIPGFGTERFSRPLDSMTALPDGRVAFRAGATSGGLASTQDDFLFIYNAPGSLTTVVQAGFLTPTNQFNGTNALLVGINDDAYVSADGSRYLIDGALNLASNSRSIIVNGRVELQAGAPIPGLGAEVPSASTVVDAARMFPGGNWAAWGTSNLGTAYAVVDGALYVREGDLVPGGLAGETIVSIGEVTMNGGGDIAYVARTTAGRDAIVVDPTGAAPILAAFSWPSTSSLGTQIDLDGDGLPDDAYLAFINDETLSLGSNGDLYVVGRALNSGALTEADGLFVIPTPAIVPEPSAGLLVGLAGLAAASRRRQRLSRACD